MKIAMMSAWNEDSGASTHAELIGREWVKMGHDLRVFSFFPYDFHGTVLVGEDEEYVLRCFTTSSYPTPYLDPRHILEEDFEIFVVHDLGMLPKNGLFKIFHHIQRKSRTVTVIHDNCPSPDPSFYQFDWDRVVCFDDRYREFLRRYYTDEMIRLIPFPCVPLRRGNREAARARLGLPLDRKILLIFGQRLKDHLAILPWIREVNLRLSCLLLVVSQKDLDVLEGIDVGEVEIRKESPSIQRLYEYLHAADVLLVHRLPKKGAVVSSTAFQCLGSGCPILAAKSGFFETLKGVVVTYSNEEEFKTHLFDLLTRGERYRSTQKALEEFLKANSAGVVAMQYIELFKVMLEEKRMTMLQEPLKISPRLMNMNTGFSKSHQNVISSH